MISFNKYNDSIIVDNKWIIVIPTLNRPDEISYTLKWILKFKTLPYAIFIIDQSSIINDEIIELTKKSSVHIHYEFVGKPLGSGYARNYLMDFYNSEYILFLDDDVHSEDSNLDLIGLYSSYFKSNAILSYIDGGYFPTIITQNFKRERYIDLK